MWCYGLLLIIISKVNNPVHSFVYVSWCGARVNGQCGAMSFYYLLFSCYFPGPHCRGPDILGEEGRCLGLPAELPPGDLLAAKNGEALRGV